MHTGARPRVLGPAGPSATPNTVDPRTSRWRSHPSFRRQHGATSTEVLVISGVVVATLLVIMVAFRQEVTSAMAHLTRCIAGATSGDLGACSSGAPQQAAASNPNAIPGMRSDGIAGGLVMAGPGGAGGGGAAGGPGGGASGNALTAGMAPGGLGSLDPKTVADYRAQLIKVTERINGFQKPELSWQEQGTRLWNATSLFQSNRDLNARQDELNDMATTSHIRAQTWAQIADQRLAAGDVSGFQQAMNNARRNNQMSNGMQGRSASIMADAADQAMGEAANIRQLSFATASAIANPTGFVAGQAAGFVVSTAADQVLPDGRIKQVVVAVASAGAAAYAGGMTPSAWQNLGGAATAAGQQAGVAIGIADQVTSVTTTYNTQGGTEAAWEVITAALVHGVTNTRVKGLSDGPDGPPRSLSEYLSQAPSAAAMKEKLENTAVPYGQFEVTANNIRNAYETAKGNKPTDPITYQPLEADRAYLATVSGMKNPDMDKPEVQAAMEQAYADGRKLGQTPDMVLDKIKHAQATGGTFFDRGTQIEATEAIQAGEAIGKGTPQHQKSAGTVSEYLPMDTMEAKPGQALRAAQQALADATTPEQTLKANQDITKAWGDVADNQRAIQQSLAAGTVVAGPSPDPKITGPVSYDPITGLPFVGDVDPVTNNVSRPGDPIRNGGERGLGTFQELQDVANLRSALANDNLASTANHGAGSRNPGKEPLPDFVIRYTPDGKVTVIKGQVNVLNAIRESGSAEHPSWAAQAQAAVTPEGPQLIPPPADPVTPYNRAQTESQAALANNRNTLRGQYVDVVQQNSQWKTDEEWFYSIESGIPQSEFLDRPTSGGKISLVSYRYGSGSMDSRIAPAFTRMPVEATTVLAARQAPAPAATGSAAAVTTDWSDNHAFKTALNKTIERYKSTWESRQILVHLKAYEQMRGHVLAEFAEKERLDGYVTWAFGVGRNNEPLPLPTVNQSALYERIDAQAMPAWRADLDGHAVGGLHSGLVQYYTKQALAVGKRQTYPAYPAQAAMAKALLSIVGEATVRKAYFLGDVRGLYARVGTMLGASGPAQAQTAGFTFVQQLDQVAMNTDTGLAQQLLRRLGKSQVKPARAVPPSARDAERPVSIGGGS